MAWMALQEAIIAGNADAESVAARCMEGRGSDYEREQVLVKLYKTNELPEYVSALIAPAMLSSGDAAGGDTCSGQSTRPTVVHPPR